jgi:hypothetical protein
MNQSEIKKSIAPKHFSIKNLVDRVEKVENTVPENTRQSR